MKQYYGYEEFQKDTHKLMQKTKSFHPEAIVGIARGGLTLAHCMGEGLNIREVQTLRTELYDARCKRENISLFGTCSFTNISRVLVLDDIADSGETLKETIKYLEENFKGIEFRAATLFYKKSSVYEPHYWVNKAVNWIEFFWELDFKTNAPLPL